MIRALLTPRRSFLIWRAVRAEKAAEDLYFDWIAADTEEESKALAGARRTYLDKAARLRALADGRKM